MTSSRRSQPGLGAARPSARAPRATHRLLCSRRCCYTDAKRKSPRGFCVNTRCGVQAPPPPLGCVIVRKGVGPSSCALPRRNAMSKPRCLKEGALGTARPCPSVQGANCPSPPVSLGLWGLVVVCPRPRTSVPPASDAAHARGGLCSQRQLGPEQGFRNQMCVVAILCVSLSYFNTKFIMCSEINVRKYHLSD